MSELKTLIDYIPAQLHECKSRWYIDFYVYHPIGKRLYRQQLRINRVVSISERRRFAKNHNDMVATIPDVMIELTKEVLSVVKNDEYVFLKNFLPGRKQISRRVISRFWEQLRTPLQLEKELKFYSLRDSGIIEKIRNGIDLITVMQLADHSSLEITNAYVKLASRDANKEAMKKF